MEWSTDLHLVSLLQKYLSPPPRVTTLVRAQLMTIEESDRIETALRHVKKLWRTIDTPYDALLNHSCLDWRSQLLVDRVSPALPPAMFDLMLGDKPRRLLLNRYTEVHNIRRRIEKFVEAFADDIQPRPQPVQLWWDGVSEDPTPHRPWVSRGLAEDRDFEALLESWVDDSRVLQGWLRQFEKTTLLVNNRDQKKKRVFSGEVAIQVMKFGKVGSPSAWCGRQLTPVFRPKETCSIKDAASCSQQSMSGLNKSVRHLACLRPDRLDSLRCSSTSLPKAKPRRCWDSLK